MSTYSLEELRRTFEALANTSDLGPDGTKVIDSGKQGPTVGLTICTHGNEPSGLAAFQRLLDTDVAARLQRGRLVVVINNLKATSDYFASTSEEEQRGCRFVDVNMNRLPEDREQWSFDQRYDVQRARELLPVWEQFDAAMDIHSTRKHSPAMFIVGDHVSLEHLRDFPIRTMISRIHHEQIGLPTYCFYGGVGQETPVFEIEAGQHTSSRSFARAGACTELYLQNVGVLARPASFRRRRRSDPIALYEIGGTIIAPNRSYKLTKVFKDFELVEKGTVLATGDGGPIVMPWSGHVVFAPSQVDIRYPDEEVMFLSRPVRNIER